MGRPLSENSNSELEWWSFLIIGVLLCCVMLMVKIKKAEYVSNALVVLITIAYYAKYSLEPNTGHEVKEGLDSLPANLDDENVRKLFELLGYVVMQRQPK